MIEVSQILRFFDRRYSRKGSLNLYSVSVLLSFAETYRRPHQIHPLHRVSVNAQAVPHATYNWYEKVGYFACRCTVKQRLSKSAARQRCCDSSWRQAVIRFLSVTSRTFAVNLYLCNLHLIHLLKLNLAMNGRPPAWRQRSITGVLAGCVRARGVNVRVVG